jgi:hypothetical protein
MARAVDGLLKTIKSNDNLPEWGQEKIAKAEMMLVSVWDYLLSQKELGMDPKINEGKAVESLRQIVAELSSEKLGQYKKAAGAQASAADKAGDTKKADKRFSGIVKATKKQFANDEKGLAEDANRAEAQANYMEGQCMVLAVAINQHNPKRYPIGYIWEYNMSAGAPDMQMDDDEWEYLSPEEQEEISNDISRHSVVHAYVRDQETNEYIDARGRHKTLPNLWGRMGQTRFEEFPGTARELIDITAHGDWDEVSDQVNFKRGRPAFDSLAGPAGVKKALDYAVKYLGVVGPEPAKSPNVPQNQQGVAEGDRPFRGVGGAFNRGDDERHDLDPTEWYIVKDGKMFKTSVYPNQVQLAIAQGYSRTRDEAKAKAGEQGVAEKFDPRRMKSTNDTDVRTVGAGAVRVPSDASREIWNEPTWSFKEIADKLGVSTNTLNLLAWKQIGGFPDARPGLTSKHGSSKYYKQSEVKRWVNANKVRELIKGRVATNQSVAEAGSNAIANTASRLANKDDGKVAKLRAAGDKRREEELKGRNIAKKNEAMLPTSAFAGSDKNKLAPQGQLKGTAPKEQPRHKLVGETDKKKGADGKACWKNFKYAGTKNGKDKCVPIGEAYEAEMAAAILKLVEGKI